MAQLEGVDVSHHNGVIQWKKAKDAGISFALIKATQGISFVDPKAQTNRAGCHAAGIVPGMYHFYRHDVDPVAQAAYFLQHIGQMQPGELPPAIDVEGPGDGAGPITYPKTEVVNRVGEFVRSVRKAIGRAPLIYTYPSTWKEITGNSNAFSDSYPLWIASYGVPQPKLIGGWTKYTFWQYTDQGTVSGIGSGVDRDRFNGDMNDLKAFMIGELATSGKAVLSQDANVRQAPGLTSSVAKVLPRGTDLTIIEGPRVVNAREWWKVDDGAGTIGWCSDKVLTPT
ncbi:MAG TPA: GH25 family lysozyme [Longimicrobium sp.]|jgi:GH25 family lysozyme M1 (1,4-beta-N-acetylmuramidase)